MAKGFRNVITFAPLCVPIDLGHFNLMSTPLRRNYENDRKPKAENQNAHSIAKRVAKANFWAQKWSGVNWLIDWIGLSRGCGSTNK